jgi:hypothetical protein
VEVSKVPRLYKFFAAAEAERLWKRSVKTPMTPPELPIFPEILPSTCEECFLQRRTRVEGPMGLLDVEESARSPEPHSVYKEACYFATQ